MIDVSELLDDPDFVQTVPVKRQSVQIATLGAAAGEAVVTQTTLSINAAVMPLKAPNDLLLLPEGVRSLKSIVIYSKAALYADDGDNGTPTPTPMTVDVLTYRSEAYKVAHVAPYAEYGYYKAIAVIDNRAVS